MNQQEILKFFSLPTKASKQDVIEKLEEELFSKKQKLLGQLYVPKTLMSFKRGIQMYINIEKSILEEPLERSKLLLKQTDEDILTFLRNYEANYATINLCISKTVTFFNLDIILESFVENEMYYLKKWNFYFNKFGTEANADKLTNKINTGLIIQALNNGGEFSFSEQINELIKKENQRVQKILELEEK